MIKAFGLFGSMLAVLVLVGGGCAAPGRQAAPGWTPPAEQDPPIGENCPDVCAAICAGQPEPQVPANCAMPMCACDTPNGAPVAEDAY